MAVKAIAIANDPAARDEPNRAEIHNETLPAFG
jgi:hypothetical protein